MAPQVSGVASERGTSAQELAFCTAPAFLEAALAVGAAAAGAALADGGSERVAPPSGRAFSRACLPTAALAAWASAAPGAQVTKTVCCWRARTARWER